MLEVFRRRQAIDLSVVKRTRTQERQLPRKSARLAGSHQKQPSPEVVRRKSRRHNLRSGVHRGEVCHINGCTKSIANVRRRIVRSNSKGQSP